MRNPEADRRAHAQADPALQYPGTSRGDVARHMASAWPIRTRWFEDPNAPATRDWVSAETAVSQPYLENLPQRAWLGERLKQLWTYDNALVCRAARAGAFLSAHMTARRIRACCTSRTPSPPSRCVLRIPNGKRDDATIALSQWEPSRTASSSRMRSRTAAHDWNTLALSPRLGRHRPAGDPQIQQVLERLVGARQLGRLVQPLSAEAESIGG